MNLRGFLREGVDDAEIAAVLTEVWAGREDRYSESRAPASAEIPLVNKVEMYRMGG